MTPNEITEFVGERSKADLTLAWSGAVLHRMDIKQFPRSPTDLMGTDRDPEQQTNQILAVAKSLKASQDREKKRAKGAPDIIIHKEIKTE